MLRHVAEDVLKLAKVTLEIIMITYLLFVIYYVNEDRITTSSLFFDLQDGLERRGFKEMGFLNEVAEVVRTGKIIEVGFVYSSPLIRLKKLVFS